MQIKDKKIISSKAKKKYKNQHAVTAEDWTEGNKLYLK